MNFSGKMQRCNQYVEALEEEKRKIQVFQRELPLCLELVTQAIETCRRELLLSGAAENMVGSSECTDQTMSEGRPVLEEFIPIKRNSNSNSDNELENDDINENNNEELELENDDVEMSKCKSNDSKKKSDWLRSVQLWNNQSSPDPPSKEELPRKAKVMEVKRSEGGAFHPFQKEKSPEKSSTINHKSSTPPPKENGESLTPPPKPASSTSTRGNDNNNGSVNANTKKDEKDDARRKQRRCWSPELHRRFLQSLQQLGGSHAATPKQIRELMKVDGLTNDEVKSHLQKYRLHTRRPVSSAPNNGNNNTQAPQFLVVGGIWVPPPEYTSVTATSAPGDQVTTNGIYTPVATHQTTALLFQTTETEQLHDSEGGGCSHAHSNSPATSNSSSRTS